MTIQCSADVAVAKEGPATAASRDNVTYFINVTSLGPATATGVALTDTLPATGGVVGGADAASCGIVGAELTCSFGDMAAGDTAEITVSHVLTGCDDIDNMAFVDTTAFELATANNASAHTVNLGPCF